jgi:hypothetical protein
VSKRSTRSLTKKERSAISEALIAFRDLLRGEDDFYTHPDDDMADLCQQLAAVVTTGQMVIATDGIPDPNARN